MAGQYVCKLDEATQRKAQEELNEDPNNRQGAIDTFRQWILQQKHIKCPTDADFLLLFLRVRKFSQLEARKQLETFLTAQAKLSAWCKDLDTWDTDLQRLVKEGLIILLPGTDEDGRRIVLARPGSVDMRDRMVTLRSAMMLFFYIYLCNEEMVINGCVCFADYSGITHKKDIVTSDDRKNIYQMWQKNIPCRMKGIHIYNAGILMEFILTVVKVALSAKMKKRLVMHGQTLENLYKYIPMEILPREYLPDEYNGPSAGPVQDNADRMLAAMTRPEIRERIKYLTSSQFTIDLSQKDEQIPQESFRRLNVD